MDIFSEIADLTIKYAAFVGFIGMGAGLILGVGCRAITSVINIINKF